MEKMLSFVVIYLVAQLLTEKAAHEKVLTIFCQTNGSSDAWE